MTFVMSEGVYRPALPFEGVIGDTVSRPIYLRHKYPSLSVATIVFGIQSEGSLV